LLNSRHRSQKRRRGPPLTIARYKGETQALFMSFKKTRESAAQSITVTGKAHCGIGYPPRKDSPINLEERAWHPVRTEASAGANSSSSTRETSNQREKRGFGNEHQRKKKKKKKKKKTNLKKLRKERYPRGRGKGNRCLG